ncbi:MAG: N-acetylmuramoyl-L-alanine amidase [Christensenellaceae bacterium]|jgi:N-acetylmuramoyl-L-alanine amidase|nr:N-acetylmuramoyl-L-alanine amidase [Christensenellaceae bacterium]
MATVVLDAGHGGFDAGAVNGDRYEKTDNLRMAQAVGGILQRSGINVIYTRTGDDYISLGERANIANNSNADMFVSFHRNSAVSPDANGFENFVAPTASAKSKQWAKTVYDAVANTNIFTNRGLKEANYYLLKNTKMPAQLLELGFISNDGDNEKFDTNFNRLAETIAAGIMTDLGVSPTPPTPTPTHRDRVRNVQQMLNDIYDQNLTADGIVGPATKRALIRSLQMQLNSDGRANPPLAVDGIWGTRTRSAVPTVRNGSRGNTVWLVQAELVAHGYDIATDGIFGAGTQNAVMDFQRQNGLTADGIVGQNTYEKLFNW